MFKIVKFRVVNLRKESDGWRSIGYNNFKEYLPRVMPTAFTINTKLYESSDSTTKMDNKYELIDAWDWLRMGIFPHCDLRIRELALERPDDYRLTKNGVWARRRDLLTPKNQSISERDVT